jgi:hypothetical protein
LTFERIRGTALVFLPDIFDPSISGATHSAFFHDCARAWRQTQAVPLRISPVLAGFDLDQRGRAAMRNNNLYFGRIALHSELRSNFNSCQIGVTEVSP